MTSGFPDWTRAVLLTGKDPDGNFIAILADETGKLTVPFQGQFEGELQTVALDTDGRIIARIVGYDGEFVRNVALDSNGQIIMVPRGESGNYMSIDAEGFMTAILKGSSDGVLKTIGLDDEGRISGYLVDDIDLWGQILRVGNAEQAARLGSPVTWDRRGQTQLVLDFASGFQGVRPTSSGTGAAVELSPEWAQHGGYSVKLTGGSDASKYASIRTYAGFPPTGRWGGMLNWSAEATPEFLEIRLGGVVDNASHTASIRYDFANTKLQYKDTGNNWQDVGVKDLEPNEFIFHKLKMVIDTTTDTYERVLLNNTQFDLSATLQTSAAPTSGDYMYFQVLCFSNAGDNDVIYVDTIVTTVLEP